MFDLLTYMNWTTGLCYPKMERIAQDTNLSYRCVIDAVASLEEKGLIQKYKRKMGADTAYYNNVYRIIGWDTKKLDIKGIRDDVVDKIISQELE